VSRRALAALLLIAGVAAPAAAEEIKTIPTRAGVTQSFVLLRRSETPVATVILFAGGKRELLTFEGGDPPQSRPCEARAAHGYLGLDAQVVKAIADWIKATPRP